MPHLLNTLNYEVIIISYAIGFTGLMRYIINLNSIHSNQNIALDNGAYWLITKTHSYYKASNDFHIFFLIQEGWIIEISYYWPLA